MDRPPLTYLCASLPPLNVAAEHLPVVVLAGASTDLNNYYDSVKHRRNVEILDICYN